MNLLYLPPEILNQIFDRVGSSFFQQNLRHLTISEQWFDYAYRIFLKRIGLSTKTLRALIFSGDTTTQMSRLLRESLESLDLALGGYQGRDSQHYLQKYPQNKNTFQALALNNVGADNQLDIWSKVLDDDLAQLAIIVQQTRKLHILHISAYHSIDPFARPLDRPQEYLSMLTMQAFLSVENLSILVLDLPVGLLAPTGRDADKCHLCPVISNLLGTLRILHIRMREICPDVLKHQSPTRSLQLREVVINFSLFENIPGITSATHSTRCKPSTGGLLQSIADMRQQAETLAEHMRDPKILRILTHRILPQFHIHSLNVLSGRTMLLDSDMEWNDDGDIIEKSEPETDSIDDDGSNLSFFSDEE